MELVMKKIFLISVIIFIISGCSDFKDSLVGTAGEKCFGNGTCKDGLFCIDGKCVEELDANTDNDTEKDDSDAGDTGDTGNTGNTGDTGDDGNTGNTGDDSDSTGVETEVDEDVINDPCDPNPCTTLQNSTGECLPDVDESHVCTCNDGFEWIFDDKVCNAIPDPCLDDPCTTFPNSECVAEKADDNVHFTGNYTCECFEGYAKTMEDNSCIPAYKSVTVGKDHVCAINYWNQLFCWGNNFNGQLGNDYTGHGVSDSKELIPARVNEDSWTLATVGEAHTCGISALGEMLCWGYNYYGQVGNNESGPDKEVFQPVSIYPDNPATISAGRNHNCSIDSGNKLYCWGWNNEGQLGNGAKTDMSSPSNIQSTMDWKTVDAGDHHTCGINSYDDLYCWGWNYRGQLGDTTNDSRLSPVQIGIDKWKSVSAGSEHTCGITANDFLFCWGNNTAGQLGNDTQTDSDFPVKIGESFWQKVSAGSDHTCAIDTNSGLFCWGNNYHGQLGLGLGVDDYNVPYQVMGQWMDVSAGNGFTCGITDGYALYCWGVNDFGQLGQNTSPGSINSPAPVTEYKDHN